MSHDRISEAESIIKKAAKFNKVSLPGDCFTNKKDTLRAVEETNPLVDNETLILEKQKYNISHMFRTPQLCRRSIIMFFIWLVLYIDKIIIRCKILL